MEKEGGVEEDQSLELEGGGKDQLNQSTKKKEKNVKFDEQDNGTAKKTNDMS